MKKIFLYALAWGGLSACTGGGVFSDLKGERTSGLSGRVPEGGSANTWAYSVTGRRVLLVVHTKGGTSNGKCNAINPVLDSIPLVIPHSAIVSAEAMLSLQRKN